MGGGGGGEDKVAPLHKQAWIFADMFMHFRHINDGLVSSIFDFDEHLEDVTKDWRNIDLM